MRGRSETPKWLAAVATLCFCIVLCGCGAAAFKAGNSAAISGLTASNSSVTFGSVPVGQSANGYVKLVNQGSSAVTISKLAITGQSFSTSAQDSLPITVAAASTINLGVQFNPASTGTVSGQLMITNSSTSTPLSVGLSGTGTVTAGPTLATLTCASNSATGSTTDACAVSLSGAATSDTAVNLASSNPAVSVPPSVTVLSGATTASFIAAVAAVTSSQAATLTANAGSASTSFALQLNPVASNPVAPVLSAFSCATASITGGSTDSCTVFLSAPASSDVSVSLASTNSAVSLPASVVIPSGAASAAFTALVSAVTTSQTATLTASASASSQTFMLQLGAFTANLDLSNLDVSFGDVNVDGGVVTQPLILTSTGNAPVTIYSVSVTGPWFSVSGATFPLVLNPGQTAILSIQFDPKSSGTATGQLTLTTNASSNSKKSIKLNGNAIPQVKQLSCANSKMTGNGTDSCSVLLNAAAGSSGMAIGLSSNSNAVALPASVMVPAGGTSAGFNSTVSSVSQSQTVTLTASTSSSSTNFSLQLAAPVPTLTISSTNVAFGNVSVNTPTTQALTLSSTGTSAVTVSSAAVTGAGFTISGVTFPLTLNPGQTAVLTAQFSPTAAGVATGQLTLSSNSSTGASTVVGLSGTGVPVLSGLSCNNNSITGSGTDNCTVGLNAAAAIGGFVVNLGSDNLAVSVPATITVPAGATSIGFSAAVSSVSTAQTATISASAGGVVQTFALQLGSSVPTLSVSPASLAFGTVSVNSPSSQAITLSSTGTAAVTVSAASVTGAGFTVSGANFPLTLNPGQTATLTVQFNPTVAGATAGQLTLTSNSSTGSSAIVGLTGTGVPVLNGLTCTTSSFSGAGTDACTVTLNAAAAGGGFSVNLGSNNTAVVVPASVTVPAGTSSIGFTATVSTVSTSQAAILTASAGTASQSFTIQLGSSLPTLGLSAASVAFGNVPVNSPTSQTVTLSSTGSASVTVTAISVAGAGYTVSGATLPLTLNPGQTAALTVQFNPTVSGSSSGQITLTSNSSSGTSSVIALSGTGVPVLSNLSCTNASITGSGTDSCTVTLNAAAAPGGFAVTLSSNSSAVTVPASVSVPAGAVSSGFTATVSSVSTAQTATLTASANSASKAFAIQLGASVPTLAVSTSTISFGSVSIGSSTTQTLTLSSTGTSAVSISAASVTGSGYSASGVSFPLTLNPGQTASLTVTFAPTLAGALTGQLILNSNSSTGSSSIVSLNGTGIPVLTNLTCSSASITGSGSDSCTVTLSAAAATGGFAVNLGSNNSAVSTPASVTVPAGSANVGFTATISAVSTTQTALLTASANGVSKSFSLQLNSSVATLSANATSVAFGSVNLNTPTTQSVTLTSTGTSAVTISAISITGTGFTVTGATLPLTLNPSQTVVLNITFNPAVTGSQTGQLTITSNSSGGTIGIGLSGTGQSVSHEVDLSWTAPTNSPDPVVGYLVLRAPSGSTSYLQLNSTAVALTSYVDSAVQSGQSFNYVVESVGASGSVSAPSNVASAVIP